VRPLLETEEEDEAMTDTETETPARCMCGKAQYATRKTARIAARKAFPGEHLSPYRCGNGWHIGHLPGRVLAGDKDRNDIERDPQPRGGRNHPVGSTVGALAGVRADDTLVDEAALFDGYDEPVAPQGTTAGERRRQKQAAAVAAGYHPLHLVIAGIKLHPDAPTDVPAGTRTEPFTCGTCPHRVMVHGGNRTYPKCDLPGRATHGDATDVKTSWPACTDYEPMEP
jgi:hypothetical protein